MTRLFENAVQRSAAVLASAKVETSYFAIREIVAAYLGYESSHLLEKEQRNSDPHSDLDDAQLLVLNDGMASERASELCNDWENWEICMDACMEGIGQSHLQPVTNKELFPTFYPDSVGRLGDPQAFVLLGVEDFESHYAEKVLRYILNEELGTLFSKDCSIVCNLDLEQDATSFWSAPYTWKLNAIARWWREGECLHSAPCTFTFWKAGRPGLIFKGWKGCIP